MTNAITNFNKSMQAKMKIVESRLEALKASSAARTEHAEKAVRAHVHRLEESAHIAKDSVDHARAEMASWVEDAKATVTDWKAKLDSSMLSLRAERAERYAEASLVVALAGVDQAEKAMLSASLARLDAKTASAAAV